MILSLKIALIVILLLLILCVKLYKDARTSKIKHKELLRGYNALYNDNSKFAIAVENFLKSLQRERLLFSVKDSIPFHLKASNVEEEPLQSIRFKKSKDGEILIYINGALVPVKLNDYEFTIDNPILSNEIIIRNISYLKTQFCFITPKVTEPYNGI